MNNAQQWAQIDLATSLDAATTPTNTTTITDPVTEKLNNLQQATTQKLDVLSKKIKNPWDAELEDTTIAKIEDADTVVLADGRKIRVSDGLIRYDAAEVPHEYDGILPESLSKLLPSWVPGTGSNHKSSYAEDKQKEMVGSLLNKNAGEVTQQDIYDVGKMQTVQALADLTRKPGEERWQAPYVKGTDPLPFESSDTNLNIPIRIRKNADKDMYGRILSPLYNVETGENVTALHASDPRLNAFAPGVPEPAKFDFGNTIKGAGAGALTLGAGIADAATTLGANILEIGAKVVGNPGLYTEEDAKLAGDFFNKYDEQWANKVSGYDPKYKETKLSSALTNFKEGNIFKGVLEAIKAGPDVFIGSLPYMAALSTGTGMVAAIASELDDSIEAYKKNNGKDPSVGDLTRMAIVDTAKVYLEKLPFDAAMHGSSSLLGLKNLFSSVPNGEKTKFAKALTEKLGVVGMNMTEEGMQEGTQFVLDYLNREYGTKVDKGLNTDEMWKSIIGGAAAGGFAGSAGAVRSTVVSPLLDKAANKVNSNVENTSQQSTTTAVTVAPEEREYMINQLDSFMDPDFSVSNNPTEQLQALYKTEDIFRRTSKEGKDPEFLNQVQTSINTAKEKIIDSISSWDDSASFKLGNKKEAEDIIDFMLESSKNLTDLQQGKLLKLAKDNDVEEYYNNAKSYYEVETEAVEGRRGYKGYERTMKTLLNADKVNVDAINNELSDVQSFLVSQENAVTELKKGIAEAQAQADKLNNSKIGSTPKQVKVKAKQKASTFEFTINFEKTGDGWKVSPSAINVLNAKMRNVQGLRDVLSYSAKRVKELGLDVNIDSEVGIVVPISSDQKVEKLRKHDRNTYSKYGVTKIISDTNSEKWNKYYAKANMSKLNRNEYTADDVVVLNAQTNIKNGKIGFIDKSVTEMVKAAQKAGATILLDNDMIRLKEDKNKKGTDLHRNYLNLLKLLGRFSDKRYKYAPITNKEGTFAGVQVFKPKDIAMKENTKIAKAAKEKKEKQKTEKNAKTAYLFEMAKKRRNSDYEINKDVYNLASEYFKKSVDGTTAETNLNNYTNRILDEEIHEGVTAIYETYTKLGSDAKELFLDNLDSNYEQGIKLNRKVNDVTTISNADIKELVFKEFKSFLMDIKDSETTLLEWKNVIENSKKDTSINIKDWLKRKLITSKKIDSISSDEEVIYTHSENNIPTHIKPKDKKFVRTLENDINRIIKVSKVTVLNSSIGIDNILQTNRSLAEKVDAAVESIEKAVNIGKFTDTSFKKGKGGGVTTNTIKSEALLDFPAGGLLINSAGEVNKEVVTAAVISLYGMLRNNAYMLSSVKKSWDDIAQMLGIEKFEMNKEIAELVQEKGMLAKTFGTDISKDMANLLGISAFNEDEVEAQRYKQVLAGLAQIAIVIGEDQGLLVADKVNQSEYAKVILKAEDSNVGNKDTTVPFIKLTKRAEEKFEINKPKDIYEKLTSGLPIEDSYRKEPIYSKPLIKDVEARLTKIKNDLSEGTISEKAKELLRKGMNTSHKVNFAMIEALVGGVEDSKYLQDIKTAMGYIAIPLNDLQKQDEKFSKYETLTYEQKEVQESLNREIEHEIEELRLLWNKLKDDKNAEVYFMMYYAKNGRYMYDSNTVNPQTQKQLTRWIIQPKDHYVDMTYDKKTMRFKANGKDITNEMLFALGQAFGYKVDGQPISKTKQMLDPILTALNENADVLDTLFQSMLNDKIAKTKTAKIGDSHVEIEHIAHAYQAIELLKELLKGKKVNTSFTAEIDAKTSGFALKTALMPILGLLRGNDNVTELTEEMSRALSQTGIIPETGVSVVDKLVGTVQDAYKTLASMMKINVKALTSEEKSAFGKGYNISKENVEVIHNELPKQNEDGSISSELRNLFKQPFMEFNYSAALKSVRQSLAYTITGKLVASAANSKEVFDRMRLGMLLGMSHAQFQETVRNNPLSKVKVLGLNISLEKYLNHIVDMTYGQKVEEIFKKEYKEAILAQGVINQAYQSMFKVYALEYNRKLKELRESKGFVTVGDYKQLIKDLRKVFPVVKGPLSNLEGIDDGIAIYSTKTASPTDLEAGAPGSQIALNSDWSANHGHVNAQDKGFSSAVLQYEIKKFESAISAGSVVPIHYMDGALMAMTGTSTDVGLTMVHDAIMAPITEMFNVAYTYNKNIYDMIVNKESRYQLVGELLKSTKRVISSINLDDFKQALDKPIEVFVRTMDDDINTTSDKKQMTLRALLDVTVSELEKLEALVTKGQSLLDEAIEQNGLSVSNLVASDLSSVYIKGAEVESKDILDKIQQIAEEEGLSSELTENIINIAKEGCF